MLLLRISLTLVALYAVLVVAVVFVQRSLLYFPSHAGGARAMKPWVVDGAPIGYCVEDPSPRAIWLMLHGNGGEAASRDYVLPLLAPRQSFYVLEYPGYGARPGKPSRASIDAAALEAYTALRARHPGVPVCVLGESLGSGPASMLADQVPAPDKIVLVVPFARLADLAAEQFWFLPARWILRDRWDNVAALRNYRGRLEIYGAREDRVIPSHHAKALADALPGAVFRSLPTGHNDWSYAGGVRLEL